MMFARNPREREALAGKAAVVVGCGSVGCALAELLVRAGIGKLTLIDPEALAPENLARHVLTAADLMRPKASALREHLLAVNAEIRIEAHDSAFTIGDVTESWALDPPQLIISAVDSFRCESMINAVSLQLGIPVVYIGCWGPASVGEILYVVPAETPCYECFAAFRKREEHPTDARKYTDPDFDDTRVSGQPGLWANILVVAGIAFQIILGLFGLRPEVIDHDHTLFLVNVSDFASALRPLATTFARVKKGCAICDESLIDELTA